MSRPVLDVVIPVYNEERDLGPCVRRLHAYLDAHLPYPFRITIADNASVDGTPTVAKSLAEEFAHVVHLRLEAKGRGLALRAAWTGSDAPVLAYMDVDLSTDLAAVLPLVAPLISGHSDLAIGTRLARGSRVVRGPKRELISRGYTCSCAGRSPRRSPTRSAGSRRSAPTSPGGCCRWCRTPAGSSTPSCSCWPSGPGCASTRCRSTGSTTPTAGSTSSPPRSPTSVASRGSAAGWRRARCRSSRCGASSAGASRAG